MEKYEFNTGLGIRLIRSGIRIDWMNKMPNLVTLRWNKIRRYKIKEGEISFVHASVPFSKNGKTMSKFLCCTIVNKQGWRIEKAVYLLKLESKLDKKKRIK
jgi:hypothetical protein